MKHLLAVFFSSIVLCSCVGTIEETTFETTEVVSDKISYQNFIGIDEAIAISHDKAEIYFHELDGVPSDKVAYQIFYEGAEFPIFISGSSVSPRADGRLMYTVDNLLPDREYFFQVQVLNLESGLYSLNDEKRSIRTFSNRTASFEGVQSVFHQPGPDGLNFIKVNWSPAVKEASGPLPMPSDPAKYEVTVLSADRILADFDNKLLSTVDRKVVYFNSSESFGIVGGLVEGQTYYVRVRAYHTDFVNNGSNGLVRHEENNKYIEITMLSGDADNLNFDPTLFFAVRPEGAAGLNSVNLNWSFPTGGAYNHFRVYFQGLEIDDSNLSLLEDRLNNINPFVEGCPFDPNNIFCQRLDFRENSFDALDLNTNKTYVFILAVCIDESCSKYKLSRIQSQTTFGELANFDGILDYKLGKTFDTLDELTLIVKKPDLTLGVLDGVVYYHDISNGQNEYKVLNHPYEEAPEFGSPLELLPYNFASDSEVVLKGINKENLIKSFLGQEQVIPYYFKFARYTFADGIIETDLAKDPFVVKNPKISLVSDSFEVNCKMGPSFTKIDWVKPISGIYSHYRINVYRNDIPEPIDTMVFESDVNEFSSLNYYLELQENESDEFYVEVIPVILFNSLEIKPTYQLIKKKCL